MLSIQVGILKGNPDVDLVFANFLNRDYTDGREDAWFNLKARAVSRLETMARGRAHVISRGMPESLLIANFIATDTVVVRRALLDRVGSFATGLRNSEDLELWWRLALAGARFAFVDDMLLSRHWLGSCLSRQSVESCQSRIMALDSCRREAISRGRSDLLSQLDTACQRAWRNLMRQYALLGDRREALRAFRESTRYGICRSSLLILAKAMVGAKRSSVE
jgi:hypothetical protein